MGNKKLTEEDIDDIFKRTHDDHKLVESQVGWLISFHENIEVISEKVDQSLSGHALFIAHQSVLQSIMMFLRRSIDDNGHSYKKLINGIYDNQDLIKARFIKRSVEPEGDLTNCDWVQGMASALKGNMDAIEASLTMKAVHLHRDTELAHRLNCATVARKKIQFGADPEKLLPKEIAKLAEKILNETHQASIVWNGGVWELRWRKKSAQRNCEMLWQLLPKLADVEKIR